MGSKGDLMDGILWSARLAQDKNEAPQIADYPEAVIRTLRTFQSLWKLPERAIPSKNLKGQFARWVSALQELNYLAGDKIDLALKKSFEKYSNMEKPFIVSNPLAIKKLMIDALAEMNRKTETVIVQEKTEPVADKNNLLEMARKLKRGQ